MSNYSFSIGDDSQIELTKQDKADIILSDALIMTPGWEDIPAAHMQIEFASLVGIDILYESSINN